MDEATLYTQGKAFLVALAYSQPRILGMFIAIPIFGRAQLPGMLRLGVAAGFGALVAPTLMPQVTSAGPDGAVVFLILVKEAIVGFILGFMVAIPFWVFEAIGFLIDNQRGASIAASLNPLTGNDSSPLGILFNQAFIVFFFVSGGFLLLLEVMYESFRLWNVFSWAPVLHEGAAPFFLEQLMRIVRTALVLSAPAIVAMFLSEMGLALVSRFVPQLQVFFMAMPIKSALALLVLILYMTTLFDYTGSQLQQLREIVPALDGQWRSSAGGGR
ncbi:type III secretion system export apparatus subunit SctT [Ramlibacter sp. MAHUQ-53]|uniref:type III secretion system export apparatus subunit SctT n=1 Tax=unclassified Ramlibacter TaxID=2617605 RepID=UPI0036363BBC